MTGDRSVGQSRRQDAWRGAALVGLLVLGGACSDPTTTPGVPVGVLLSYSGDLAGNSINSERALLLAFDRANAAGGVGGRPLVILPRDTRSDPGTVGARARELVDGGAAIIVGPDTRELAVQLKSLLEGRTLLLPSFTTAESTIYKPHSWFVMGAGPVQVACELVAQMALDGRKRPVVIADPNGYDALLAWFFSRDHMIPGIVLPRDNAFNDATVEMVRAAGADAYVLGALPPFASSLLYALAAAGELGDPTRWYLSPTLHSPALLETIPRGMFSGARGVSTGTVAGANAFRREFVSRWEDEPLDDAYPFYDAGAIAALALQRALVKEGAIPTGIGLSSHIIAVTSGQGTSVGWDELDRGLALLRQGEEIGYEGVTGRLEFDATGQTRSASTKWWRIEHDRFVDVPSHSRCR